MKSIKIPFFERWLRFRRSRKFGCEEEIVEYCIYQRLHLGLFCIEINDWSEDA